MIESLELDNREVIPYRQAPIKTKEQTKEKSLFGRMFKKDKLKKPKKVAVIYLRNSGIAEPIEIETKKGFFNIDGRTYHERRDCTYTVTKDRIPLAIIREDDLIPMGTKQWEDKTLREKFAELQDHTLRGIRHAELVKMGDKDRGNVDLRKIIGFGILGIIIIAVLFQVL
jgi:hypothetical protein